MGKVRLLTYFPDKQRQAGHTVSSLAVSVYWDTGTLGHFHYRYWIQNETVTIRLKCLFSDLRVLEGIQIHNRPIVWTGCSMVDCFYKEQSPNLITNYHSSIFFFYI